MNSPHDLASELIGSFSAPVAVTEPVRRGKLTRAGLGESLAFPAEEYPRADLLTTLRTRRSTRFFDSSPVPASMLAGIMAHGIARDAESWADEQGCCGLSADVVAFRVDGLEPAMYSFDPPALSYTALASLPADEALRDMTVQSEFCDAAAIVMITGDVEHAAQTHGGHGYRLLMGRAGAAAYAMWLEAVAHGLIGTVFAGFIPASVRLPLHCDGSSRHQLFALALGSQVKAAPDVADGTGRQ